MRQTRNLGQEHRLRRLGRRLAQLNLQFNRAGIVGVGDVGRDRTKKVTHLIRHRA